MTDDYKSLVREWLQAVDTGDVGVLDKYLDSGFIDHNPPPFQGPNTGVQGAKDAFSYALGAFSNFRHEVEEQFVDGDRVISRITGYGTHTGEFLGIPPTGKEVRMEGIAISWEQCPHLARSNPTHEPSRPGIAADRAGRSRRRPFSVSEA